MNFKVLLIGCGDIGSRHLQAISTLPEIGKIYVVDPCQHSLELGKKRLSEVPKVNQHIKFEWLNHIENISKDGDLCIVATQAQDRFNLIKKLSTKLNYRRFVIEKIVTQSVQEYKKMESFALEKNLSIWINCQRQTFSIHKYIKSQLTPSEPIIFNVSGENWGLATNGIHETSLFVFYDAPVKIHLEAICVDPFLYPSKRGTAIFDLSGFVCGYTEKGSKLILNFSNQKRKSICTSIISPRARFRVDHINKLAYESFQSTHWRWERIPMTDNLLISFTSRKLISDILHTGRCDLPSLSQCFPAHEFILTALLPQFNSLLNQNNDYCPIT